MSKFHTTIEVDEEERGVVITASHVPAERGDTDGPRGRKLEPDVPAHWEVESVCYDDGTDVPGD